MSSIYNIFDLRYGRIFNIKSAKYTHICCFSCLWILLLQAVVKYMGLQILRKICTFTAPFFRECRRKR